MALVTLFLPRGTFQPADDLISAFPTIFLKFWVHIIVTDRTEVENASKNPGLAKRATDNNGLVGGAVIERNLLLQIGSL